MRATIVELGGTFSATTSDAGTRWSISIPVQPATLEGHVFRVPGLPFPIVVDGSWTVTATPSPAIERGIDLAHDLGFADAPGSDALRYAVRGATGAVWTDQAPELASARRIVAAKPPARGEVVVVDGAEGLLLHGRPR